MSIQKQKHAAQLTDIDVHVNLMNSFKHDVVNRSIDLSLSFQSLKICAQSLLNTHISFLNKFYIARICIIWDFYTCYKTKV